MNALNLSIVIAMIIGFGIAIVAPGVAIGLVVLGLGLIALFGPRAE